MVNVKDRKKQDSNKNYLGPRKDQNKFKTLGGSNGPNWDCYVCGKHINYVLESKNKSPKMRQMLFKLMITYLLL